MSLRAVTYITDACYIFNEYCNPFELQLTATAARNRLCKTPRA
jgi:hypothetical protein